MRAETAIYRVIARTAARSLGSLDPVVGVYSRRSVAAGEVVLGRSDIDIHVVITPPANLDDEGELLRDLAARFERMKRLLPCLGHFDVSTRAELERWYLEQPFQWYRDRAWLRLYGEEFERPRRELSGPDRDGLLWWYFWAAQLLPANFSAGNTRTCCNLVLDMFDAYRLYTGLSDGPRSRADLVELWYASGPQSPERKAIVQAHRRGFRSHRGAALTPLYRESLALHDALSPHVTSRLEGRAAGTLRSRVPPSFVPRTYVLVERSDRPGVDAALEAMRRDGTVWVLTEAALKLYLYHRNPWEHAALDAVNQGVGLAPPPREAFRRALQLSLHREIPRHFGFAGEHRDVGPRYAQYRLYADDGFVASDPDELTGTYRRRYGAVLSTDASRGEYFLRRYPDVCRVMDELLSPAAR